MESNLDESNKPNLAWKMNERSIRLIVAQQRTEMSNDHILQNTIKVLSLSSL